MLRKRVREREKTKAEISEGERAPSSKTPLFIPFKMHRAHTSCIYRACQELDLIERKREA